MGPGKKELPINHIAEAGRQRAQEGGCFPQLGEPVMQNPPRRTNGAMGEGDC